jgi:hypothetical protein
MRDSIAPPESPHERTNSLFYTGKIPVAPPALSSRIGSTSSESCMHDSRGCESSFPEASVMAVSPTALCNEDDGATSIQPLSCCDEVQTKCVHYSDQVSVHLIENACEEWSIDELDAVWYSQRSLSRQRRTAHQLANTMSFYSDDDLMDRFGLVSIRRQLDRMKEIRIIADCVLKLYCDYGITFWDNDSPVVVGVAGNWEKETEHQLRLFQRYHLVTKLSERLALRRASLVAHQLENDSRAI